MSGAVFHEWRPIADLPESWKSLALPHLHNIAKVWRERLDDMAEGDKSGFVERLKREWAIETGLIEHLYTLDEGTTKTLIEMGLHADYVSHGSTNKNPVEVIQVIGAQKDALEGLFAFVKGDRDLGTSYIKELHAVLTRHQDETVAVDLQGSTVRTRLLRGEWKKLPNNPTRPDGSLHLYCPPEHTAAEIDRLMDLHRRHREAGVPPEVEAAFLHHRFTQIHPFQDGNGRVARCLAALEYLRAGLLPPVVPSSRRKEYLHTLEKADKGDLGPLVDFLGDCAEKALTAAMNYREHPEDMTPEEAAMRYAQTIAAREQKNIAARDSLQANAQALLVVAAKRVSSLNKGLTSAFQQRGIEPIEPKISPLSRKQDITLACGTLSLTELVVPLAHTVVHISPESINILKNTIAIRFLLDYEPTPETFTITPDDTLEDLLPPFNKWLDKALVRLFETLQAKL